MAFYEEEKSRLEKAIGRRFPLAVLLLVATCAMAYQGQEAIASILGTILGIIAAAYYNDVSSEKQTIHMIPDETTEAYNNVKGQEQ